MIALNTAGTYGSEYLCSPCRRSGIVSVNRAAAPKSGHCGHCGEVIKRGDPRACPCCRGMGSLTVPHNWSDGWGMVEERCGLCDGRGVVDDLTRTALAFKQRADAAEAELVQLRTHIALYRNFENTDQLPEPPLLLATGPSPYVETWREYMDKAAAKAPRSCGAQIEPTLRASYPDRCLSARLPGTKACAQHQ